MKMFIQRLLLLTGNVYNDSMVTIKVKEGTRSRYAKYVNFGRPRKDKKHDSERSRPPLRFLKHIAKKRKKLREIVYHCTCSFKYTYILFKNIFIILFFHMSGLNVTFSISQLIRLCAWLYTCITCVTHNCPYHSQVNYSGYPECPSYKFGFQIRPLVSTAHACCKQQTDSGISEFARLSRVFSKTKKRSWSTVFRC